MSRKQLPIGIDNFEKLITKGYYYVDKTLLIKQLLDSLSEVTLFTRPRRFGKSLNLSMLQTYFEKTKESKAHLFENLEISKWGETYQVHQERYPVIMLNFKDAKQRDFALSYAMMIKNIAGEFLRHDSILQLGVLNEKEVEKYKKIRDEEGEQSLYVESVYFLSRCLEKAYGEKTIILIDEYDVPLENAYFRGFYQDMLDFLRGILSVALKTNTSLAFAVMTGCLRVSKESIFTGLNNLRTVSIQNEYYGEYFGFTSDDVKTMLAYYDRSPHIEEIKTWYDGYSFGNQEVYNPWSLINHVEQIVHNHQSKPMAYWSNTSSNSIVRDFIEKADTVTKVELESLILGGEIDAVIHEDITYEDIEKDKNNLWNFLYFTGYLNKVSESVRDDRILAQMKIPNKEVTCIYRNHIIEWSREKIKQKNLTRLYEATLCEDVKTVEDEIKTVLMETISYFDSGSGEAFYHGFMSGLYQGMKNYVILSNREYGSGRPDLILKYPTFQGKAVIFEFKIAESPFALEDAAKKAMVQIHQKEYEKGLLAEGYKDILKYGIGFFGKTCCVTTT